MSSNSRTVVSGVATDPSRLAGPSVGRAAATADGSRTGSLAEILERAVAALEAAGCAGARADAEALVASVLGPGSVPAAGSVNGLSPAAVREIDERVGRRAAREPLEYVLGSCAFRGVELRVDERVLIPRRETELLVEVALWLPHGARVHEVGTGSGAVALSLLEERPDLRVSASDLSPDAVELARANAERLGLRLEVSVARGLPAELDGGCELVLANLPYVTETTLLERSPEVSFEPHLAVVGDCGQDGLGVIRELVASAPEGLRLALEHDVHHGRAVRGLLSEAATHRDYAGEERVTVGAAP